MFGDIVSGLGHDIGFYWRKNTYERTERLMVDNEGMRKGVKYR